MYTWSVRGSRWHGNAPPQLSRDVQVCRVDVSKEILKRRNECKISTGFAVKVGGGNSTRDEWNRYRWPDQGAGGNCPQYVAWVLKDEKLVTPKLKTFLQIKSVKSVAQKLLLSFIYHGHAMDISWFLGTWIHAKRNRWMKPAKEFQDSRAGDGKISTGNLLVSFAKYEEGFHHW